MFLTLECGYGMGKQCRGNKAYNFGGVTLRIYRQYEVIAFVRWPRPQTRSNGLRGGPPPSMWIVNDSGRIVRINDDNNFRKNPRWFYVEGWDFRTNRPTFPLSKMVLAKYYHGALSFFNYTYPFLLVGLFMLVSFGLILHAKRTGDKTYKEMIFPALGIVFVIYILYGLASAYYGEIVDNFKYFLANIEAQRIASGKFRSLTVRPTFNSSFWYTAWSVVFVPIFIALHIFLLFIIKPIFATLYFTFVPHPARGAIGTLGERAGKEIDGEKLIASLSDVNKMPSPLISKLRAEKLNAMAEELNAETKVLKEALARNQVQAQVNDEKKENAPSSKEKDAS